MLVTFPGNPYIKEALREVYIIRGEQTFLAQAGEKLKAGDEILVSSQSQALVAYDDSSMVLVHEDSLLAFNHVKGAKWAEIKRGSTYFTVYPQLDTKPFQVLTPNCKIEVLGTSFDLMHREQKTNLAMKSGVVRLQDLVNDDVKLVQRGQVVEINAVKKVFVKVPKQAKKIWQPDGRVDQDVVDLYHYSHHDGSSLVNYIDENSKLSGNRNVSKYTFGFDSIRLENDGLFINQKAESLFNLLGQSKEMSVELWLRPNKAEESLHTGIVFSMGEKVVSSMSGQKWFFALEEIENGYALYLRSGEKELKLTNIEIAPELFYDVQHLVVTLNASGQLEIYLNKENIYSSPSSIDLSHWQNQSKAFYQVGGATSVGHNWVGRVYVLAIYKRALNLEEINQNFEQGFKFEK